MRDLYQALLLISLTVVLVPAFFPSAGNAQSPRLSEAAERFRLKHFTSAEGLSSNEVSAIQQDSMGFLWIGTNNGLVRYDGYTFQTFLPQPGDSTSIGGADIRALHVDASGRLWAGGGLMNPGGFSRYDPATGHFTRYRHDPDDANSLLHDGVTSITSSPDDPGTIWIGTSSLGGQNAGLSRLNVATGTFTHYTAEDGLPGDVWSLLVDEDGTLWAGTVGGLGRFHPATNTFTSFLPNPRRASDDRVNAILSIHEDRSGRLWVGTARGGLNRFNQESETFTSFMFAPGDRSVPDHAVTAILEDAVGTLWVTTQNGLYTFDREDGHFALIHEPSSRSHMVLHEDRYRVLWVGANWGGGLMKVERWINPFTTYQHDPDNDNSLAVSDVWPIHIDREGILWIGTQSWLNQIDRGKETVIRHRPVPGDPETLLPTILNSLPTILNSIYEDQAGTLWVSACSAGLFRMESDRSGSFTGFTHDPSDPSSIGPGCINPMLEDQAGNVWISIWGGGIDLVDKETETFTHYTSASHGLGDDQVLRLYEAPSEPGILWVGTEQGLSRFDTQGERFSNYHTESLRRTMMMHEDRTGRFWVATASSGLHLFDRQAGTIEQTFTTADGLANNVVFSLYEDDQGVLWLSTSDGLSKFDAETKTFWNYYARDGLPGNAFREHAHHQSARGELFFGGPSGAVSFFPEELVDNPVPPAVVMTGLRIGGASVEHGPGRPLATSIMMTEAIKLSYEQNDVTFEFVGLHFIEPEFTRYEYLMEGYDDAWVEAGTQRTARYPRLSPGEYVFRVRAANGDGIWSENDASVRVTVLPPWWRTWWAYGLYGLLLLGGVFAADRFQRGRLIRRERARAERQAEKLRAEAAEAWANFLQVENERQTQELEAARAVQLSMLPKTVPAHPEVKIAASMVTATEVGGDYYDFDISDDGTLTVAIGDATGHGTKAGTMVTAMKSLFTDHAGEPDLAEVLRRSARALRRMRLPKLYMALALARFRGETLELAGAGMPPALICRAASGFVEPVPLKGLPLGSPAALPYQVQHVTLLPGDTVVLMSDGFPELFGADGQMLGYARAVEVVRTAAGRPPEEIIAHMEETAKTWCDGRGPGDDMTFIVLKLKA